MRNTQRPRGRILRLAAVVALLLGAVALAQANGDYTATEGAIAGGGYRLTSVAPPAGGTMLGGKYELLSLLAPEIRGSGCCCAHLPCVLRNW
jgi:hypothetical protein